MLTTISFNGWRKLLYFIFKYKYGCRSMGNTERFYHSSRSGNFFYTMLSQSFLVHQIMLTTRDFDEQMQPREISEEESEQYDSKKMEIKGQIYLIVFLREERNGYKGTTPVLFVLVLLFKTYNKFSAFPSLCSGH
ncbi:hypothetical protein MTR67_013853 [Solanum verrucosum]|uniref:Uncharacterized protein n=1 Tax=Solanum verrucosum TaxID=315347 RepID=A0AAF0TMG0_SOLVR|nr:hypothetical protein MTR67_013853 [Solanum verrucosum]